jgi:hypothetical protein
VDRIVAIPQLDKDKDGRDIADELVEFAYNALTNRSFLEAIRRLNSASPEDVAQFTSVLSEWDLIEAVNTAHLVRGRVEIIRKFAEMIKKRVPEKPDMQDYVKEHPWLIDPKWSMLAHEQALDTLIADKFGLTKSRRKEGERRLDFFCLGDRYQVAHVVEVKRPGALVDRAEFDQLRDYVLYLRRRLQQEATNPEHKRAVVKGLLVADRIRPGDEEHGAVNQKAEIFDIRTWRHLLSSTETMHEEFLKIVKGRAPPDDPRMQDLPAEKTRGARKTMRPRSKPKKSGSRKGRYAARK